MASLAESKLGTDSPAFERAAEFAEITNELRREHPELFDDVTAVLHLNAELERSGLSADRYKYLTGAQSELVGELVNNPVPALLVETSVLARSYRGRSIAGVDYDGVKTTQFVTRDAERANADLHFQISEFPSGKSVVRIEIPLRDDMFERGESFFLTIDSEQGLIIEQQHYSRGMNRRMRLEPGSELGKDRLWRFFTHSIMATDLLDNRSGAEQQAANEQARRMLRHKIIHG